MLRFIRRGGLVTALSALVACGASGERPGGTTSSAAPLTSADAAERVRAAVRELVAKRGLDAATLASATIENVQRYGGGAIVAQLRQDIDGVEVFGGGVSVILDKAGRTIHASGALHPADRPKRDGVFVLDGADAVAHAASVMTSLDVRAGDVTKVGRPASRYQAYAVRLDPSSRQIAHSARAKQVWFQGKRLQAAWYVELDVGRDDETGSAMNAFVVSAKDGSILFRHDLVAHDAFTYRAWAKDATPFTPLAGPHGHAHFPHPTGSPDGPTTLTPVDMALVALESAPFSKKDPWLAADATSTLGNNVTAYADLAAPDGFAAGDRRPAVTAPKVFDHVYDTTIGPLASTTNTDATATNLFFVANWLHDWFYDAGFDEASRNHQTNNFGRGGIGNDPVRMEAQDHSGRNNADAATPADGASPRVQMYLFNGQGSASMSIEAPASIAGAVSTRTATFGPANFDVTAAAILVDDGTGTATDGCEPFVNAAAVKGKIALVDRGNCAFTEKVVNAEAAGAAGVVIVNNVAGGAMSMSGTAGTSVKTPVLSMSLDDGAKVKGELATGVTLRLVRDTALDRDGGLDTSIVAHEWGHVLSNRLVGNATGLDNTQGIGMGEGWADFIALMTLVHGSDIDAARAASWSGTYAMGGWVDGTTSEGAYFGIRRYPYSADLAKNPLTFKHIQNGTPLPTTAPVAYGEEGRNNAEVHATGEVWASMLWQCYVGLLRDDARLSYEQASTRMREYLVAGLKATPRSPTILEARDALLAAMYAADDADFRICAKAFAERGAGSGAIGPDRTSRTNVGVTESFVSGNDFAVVEATLAEGPTACDSDGNVDEGESATLTIKLRNDGIETLSATTAKLRSPSGVFVFEGDGTIAVPPFAPFETVEVKAVVKLAGATAISKHDLEIDLTDPSLLVPRTVTAKVTAVVDYDDAPESAKSDGFDGPTTPWTIKGAGSTAAGTRWSRVPAEGGGLQWAIIGDVRVSDRSLLSPPLVVSSDEPFTMTWSHRYSFERNRSRNWDGGVVEISTDDGATWQDVGAKASPGYGGKIEAADNDNPLAGREAFVSRSTGYPASFVKESLDLGTEYAGKTVRVRFRIGTDEGGSSPGWEIDDVAFGGITNTPFPSRVPDATSCGEPAPVEPDAGPVTPAADPTPLEAGGGGCGCRTSGAPAGPSFAALAGAAAIAVFARRRRRA